MHWSTSRSKPVTSHKDGGGKQNGTCNSEDHSGTVLPMVPPKNRQHISSNKRSGLVTGGA
jgi:hypothetical protein